MKIKPLKDRVVIKYSEETMEKTAGGFMFRTSQRKNPRRARSRQSAPTLKR